MTDMTLTNVRGIDLGTEAAKARVKAALSRREPFSLLWSRLRIGITAIFLVVVLADIIVKGSAGLHAERAAAQRQRGSVGDRSEGHAQCRRYSGRRFPGAGSQYPAGGIPRCSRIAWRAASCDNILSSGAADYLRERVVADPCA